MNHTRFFLRYWLPALAWMAVVLLASGDLMSAQHTSRFIGPFLQWLIPDVTPQTIATVQLYARKLAHLTEYGVLGALWLRAFCASSQLSLFGAATVAWLVCVSCAAVDEWHQASVPSRTGSLLDVAIDGIGAGVGILLFAAASSRQSRKRQRTGFQ